MLNEKRIRKMTQLARFESKEASRAIRISNYQKRDYIVIALIKSFFLTSIAYILILALIGASRLDFLLDYTYRLNVTQIGAQIIIGYIVIVSVFLLITYIWYSVSYRKAKKRIEVYQNNLYELQAMYDDETDQDTETGRMRL